jgi:hypothetical protein
MRKIMVIVAAVLFLTACNKDKFTTAPQIEYRSIDPIRVSAFVAGAVNPVLTIRVTDGEGDLGFKSGKDTAWIHVRNILTNRRDSFLFPDIDQAGKKNLKADILVTLPLDCKPQPGGVRHVDTLFYEVFVRDFGKNKSNTIRTSDAVLYNCQ